MPLFHLDNSQKLTLVKEVPFKLEKEIQAITEKNLRVVFGFDFVKSELRLKEFRIDTLAFDRESGAFVIIEYKRDKNFSVIDQGYAYLALMLNNKADFVLEFNENNQTPIKRDEVDWSQSRVVFVAPTFTTYQKEAINFKDLPIELWEVKRFANQVVSYHQVRSGGSQESIKTISREDQSVQQVSREIKVYTEAEHLERTSDTIRELYELVKQSILSLDEIEIKPKKMYIGFVAGTNVVDIHLQKKALKLWINLPKGELEDPKGLTRDVSAIGHWGNGHYELTLTSEEHLDDVMSLIKQSLRHNKA